MRFYNIKEGYVQYLREFDNKIAMNKNGTRPYVGIVLEVNGVKYYAPFSSPKPKHLKMKNSKDFRKINQGKYGAINFNNMIPVIDDALIEFDIEKIKDEKYKRLLQNQYKYIRADEKQIMKVAEKLRSIAFAKDESLNYNDKAIKRRTCNLPLLEKVYDQADKTDFKH
ncbi:MAG: type III toxin-antitoxin system ToxN/AbiQ family toxin [Agathobacter sp.]|nr:type III toxin-antitoxin system ToxN/AbiQ family toxin [Agathobacter sp.]